MTSTVYKRRIVMFDIEELVKKFDNVYPVKKIEVPSLRNDGTTKVRTLLDIDYEKADQIRATMTPVEVERQRSVL